jgi:DNA-directed RNA polymerase specialized sigma24 family protein
MPSNGAVLVGYACSLLGDRMQAEDVVHHIFVLNTSSNTAASRYRYGLAKLRNILKPLGDD